MGPVETDMLHPPLPTFGKDSLVLAGERGAVSGLEVARRGDSSPRVVGSGKAWDGRMGAYSGLSTWPSGAPSAHVTGLPDAQVGVELETA